MKIKKKKGFTLIELLIVVAIIAILAAIAIPQFAQYRIRGYNAAANSDLRNAKTAEEALFADYQGYGSAVLATASPVTLTTEDFGSNARTITTSLSASVSMEAVSDNLLKQASSYLLFTKHKQGDREFAADGDTTSLFWCPGTAGGLMSASGFTSVAKSDDLTGKTPAGCSAALAQL